MFRILCVPVYQRKERIPTRDILSFCLHSVQEGTRTIKSNLPGAGWRRRLDGAEPLSAPKGADAYESLPVRSIEQGLERFKSQYAGGILLPPVQKLGSDPTAAGGGMREGSEWQRSAGDEGVLSPRTFAGHRNRRLPLFLPVPHKGKNVNESLPVCSIEKRHEKSNCNMPPVYYQTCGKNRYSYFQQPNK